MEPSEPQPDATGRTTLGAFDLGCVAVGGIIGVGIFFTPARVAARVDTEAQAVVAWILGGVVALLGAFVFAELGRRVPGHGGTFLYIHEAFGRVPAFVYGWANWLVIQAGAVGIIGLVLADHLDVVLFGGARTSEGGKVVVAVATILALTAVNVRGLKLGALLQNVLTIAKTAAIAGLVLLAVLAVGADAPASGAGAGMGAAATVVPATPAAPRGWLAALGAAMLPVLFSYGGWQQATFLAGAARRPQRDLPLGLIGGVSVVVAAYVSVNLAFLHLLGLDGAAASEAIAADAAAVALQPFGFGDLAARVLAALVVVSALGIMNTCCLAPPFVLAAMARAGVLPRAVGTLHPTRGVPVLAVLLQGLWAAALLLAVHALSGRATLDLLLDGVVSIDWIFYGLSALALLRLRRRGTGGPAGSPLVAAMAAVFAAFAFVVTVGAAVTRPRATLVGLAVCALGLVALRLARRR